MYLYDVMQPLLLHWDIFDQPGRDGQAERVREWLGTTLAKLREQAGREKDLPASLVQRTTPVSPA
ncbi:hypothetical protein ACWDBT_08885 [Streptomyces ardesiacus]